MNSKDTNDQKFGSPDAIQRDVLNQVDKVNSDLDRMRGRLTPGQLIDDAIFIRRGQNPREIFDHLKDNPVGTSFLAVGTLLLMEGDDHVSYERLTREKISSSAHMARERSSELIQRSRSKVENLKAGVSAGSSDIKGRAYDFIDDTKEKLQGVKERVRGVKEDLAAKLPTKEEAQGNLQDFKDNVSTSASEMKDKFQDIKEGISAKIPSSDEVQSGFRSAAEGVMEQIPGSEDMLDLGQNKTEALDPITFLALGAGLGALSGAALPVPEQEQSFVDEKLGEKINLFTTDFKAAIDRSVNVLKDEVFRDFKDFNLNFFNRSA